jgi:hypothetical protein
VRDGGWCRRVDDGGWDVGLGACLGHRFDIAIVVAMHHALGGDAHDGATNGADGRADRPTGQADYTTGHSACSGGASSRRMRFMFLVCLVHLDRDRIIGSTCLAGRFEVAVFWASHRGHLR